ncbi:MAG: rhodanese-like domain-containing protein [Desulfobacteraceae bacterium]|nr:rhodanese-like domain-containing protein [Desulfobacteraceae bacterium]
MPSVVLRQNLMKALHDAGFILLLAVAAGLAVNLIRPDSIPFVQDWSAESRLSEDDGNSLAISLPEAEALFRENKAVFLDARDKALFDEGHIKGAKSLPWYEVDDHFQQVVPGLDRQTPVITYCDGESCNLSHELALFLKNMGFAEARVLVNGWTVWTENNLPIETPDK